MMAPTGEVFNEIINSDDQPRAGWAPLWSYLNTSSGSALKQHHRSVQSELTEQEIVASVSDADDGTPRQWQLDSVPFILAADQWRSLGEALKLRATALEAILQDVYGAQELLTKDWFPRQLLFEHPGYLRPIVHHAPQRFLHLYGADLIRGPDGSWQVFADRCQAPFGLGYALQNRLVIGRSLPNLFRQTQVRALAPFYRHLIEGIRRQSAAGEHARVVLLGSKHLGDTNYEQDFLARYLDIDFVTADDLTVRGDRLWLKTLGGLVQVDVCLRFVDDRWCDPLNLRPDSLAGVPGLVDAARAGHVLMANGLGSGLLDSPAFLPLIDRCAEHLGLQAGPLPGLAAQWLGGNINAEDVLAASPSPVLLSSWFGLRQRPVSAADSDVLAAVRDRSAAYVAMPSIAPSRSPSWAEGFLTDHANVVRMYLLSDGQGGWRVLPGGWCAARPNQMPCITAYAMVASAKIVGFPSPKIHRL